VEAMKFTDLVRCEHRLILFIYMCVYFGHAGTEKSLAYCETHNKDVNHDKISDLVCHFKVSLMNFKMGDKVGYLNGMLLDGVTPIQGSAPVEIAH
jgi:hypothetical protein